MMAKHYSIAAKRPKDIETPFQALNKSLDDRVTERLTELVNIALAQSREIAQQDHEIVVRKKIELELKNSLKREELINRLIQMMNRSFDVDIILDVVTREIGAFFGVDRCLVVYYELELEAIKRLRLSAQACSSERIIPVKDEDVPWEIMALLQAEPEKDPPLKLLNASDSAQFPGNIKNYLEKYDVQTALVIEIQYRHLAFGQLVLHECKQPRTWSEHEIDFLKVLTNHIGSALYQAKLFQEQRKAKQEAEEANQQKSKILSYVAHDFKNPLDGMKRFINTLEKDQHTVLPEKHREIIGYISEGVYQLRNMVTDILDKARLEEGRITPAPEWIEITSFIDELKPMFQAMASQRSVELNVEIQPELATIKADPTHLRQILINLISNAVKYNRANGKIFLKLFKSEDEQYVVIEVQDTGLGIPSDKIPQLFTEYFRADLSQSNPVEGTGLGLAFIKKLIELSRGTITMETAQGEGSTFTVYLPLSHQQ